MGASASAQEAADGDRCCRGCDVAIRPNMIWTIDFQFDTTADGRTLKILIVIDEFTREALVIEVDRSIDADGVLACWIVSRSCMGRRTMCVSTTVLSSSRTRCVIGVDSTVPVHFSSIRARGRADRELTAQRRTGRRGGMGAELSLREALLRGGPAVAGDRPMGDTPVSLPAR